MFYDVILRYASHDYNNDQYKDDHRCLGLVCGHVALYISLRFFRRLAITWQPTSVNSLMSCGTPSFTPCHVSVSPTSHFTHDMAVMEICVYMFMLIPISKY